MNTATQNPVNPKASVFPTMLHGSGFNYKKVSIKILGFANQGWVSISSWLI